MYEKYSTERLVKMREAAYAAYYKEAVKPCGDFRKSMKFTALEKAAAKLEAITTELERRYSVQA